MWLSGAVRVGVQACRLSGLGDKSASVWVHHRLQQWLPMSVRFGLEGSITKTAVSGRVEAGEECANHARRPSANSVGLVLLLANMALAAKSKGRLPKDADRDAVLVLLRSVTNACVSTGAHPLNLYLSPGVERSRRA